MCPKGGCWAVLHGKAAERAQYLSEFCNATPSSTLTCCTMILSSTAYPGVHPLGAPKASARLRPKSRTGKDRRLFRTLGNVRHYGLPAPTCRLCAVKRGTQAGDGATALSCAPPASPRRSRQRSVAGTAAPQSRIVLHALFGMHALACSRKTRC